MQTCFLADSRDISLKVAEDEELTGTPASVLDVGIRWSRRQLDDDIERLTSRTQIAHKD
jgi:hypothetical protein